MFTLVSSGADAYVLKRLLISYEDTRTRRDFLRNCAGAMAQSGRTVAVDIVMATGEIPAGPSLLTS